MAGIYVHIPFCHAKCAYCDFYSTPNADEDMEEQVAHALAREWQMRKHELTEPINTIYLGGGTPSSLPSHLLQQIINSLPMDDAREVTIEVNPEDVNSRSAQAWRRMGFNRVSMGVQSLINSELASVGRRHSAHDAIAACNTLREAGFDNISCDLIYGLPGQTVETWAQSLTGLLDLHPQHISAYCLSYEPGTRLWAQLQSKKITEAPETLIEEMYSTLCRILRQAGYEHYEISNFSLPGMASRHNSAYWQWVPYVGLGPSAHSFDGRVRRINPSSVAKWLAKCPAYEIDEETQVDKVNDRIITGLRTAAGLPIDALPMGASSEVLAASQPWIKQGRMELTGSTLRILEEAWLVSDAILRDLIIE